MAVPSLERAMTVDEYLASSFEVDCDYIDGRIELRNLGEYDHAAIQTLIAIWLGTHDREWGVRTVVEQRVQVSRDPFRVPGRCIVRRSLPIEQIVLHPPLICLEILSPEDTVRCFEARVDDYLAFGIEHVWVVDPSKRIGWNCTADGWLHPESRRFEVPGTPIHIPLDRIFANLDEE